jgi:hypothetical protein
MPRFLTGLHSNELQAALLKEAYLAGSLTKSELVKTVIELKRNQHLKVKPVDVEKEIDELTLNHYLVGVSSASMEVKTAENLKKRE